MKADKHALQEKVPARRMTKPLHAGQNFPIPQQPQVTKNWNPIHYDVIALAASAGGLQALTQVLSGLKVDFHASLLVVQHLDPHHRSMMAEILNKRTPLPV